MLGRRLSGGLVAAAAFVCSTTAASMHGQQPRVSRCRSSRSAPAVKPSSRPSKAGVRSQGRLDRPAARLLQPQQGQRCRHSDRSEQPHRARRSRLRPAHAFRAEPSARRFRDPGAKGLRQPEADLDHHGQRPDVHGVVLDQPAILDQFLRERRQREPAAGDQVRDQTVLTLTGPSLGFAQTLSATVGQPLPLRLWASDAPVVRKGAEDELAALRARGNRTAAAASRDRRRTGDRRWRGWSRRRGWCRRTART